MKKLFYVVPILMLIFSCMERFIIPSSLESDDLAQFGAGDTIFLEIKPNWDEGMIEPTDISVSQDGRIYIADKGSNSVIVFNQNGEKPTGFESLINLEDQFGDIISPIDVDIDKKMNVFFIDGSQRIFIWNQFWNEIGINKISLSATFVHAQSGIDTLAFAGTDIWFSLINDNEWYIVDGNMTDDQALIDSLINPHIFYDGRNEMNTYLDIYYQSDSSQFTGLTTPSDNENMIFVTDNYGGQNNQYRIIRVDFKRSLILELNSGDLVWAYTGQFGATVKGYGTGAGTVNKPSSLDVDYDGNLYYTQIGNYFPIHMISPNLSGDFAIYTSGFQPEADDIMNPENFSSANDIAIDNARNIYVVDKVNADVTVFNSYGEFFKKITIPTDTIIVDKDTSINKIVAVAVDQNNVVYVCDKSHGSVYRYKLSNILNEDINTGD